MVVRLKDIEEYTNGDDRVPSVVRDEYLATTPAKYVVSDMRLMVHPRSTIVS